MHVFLVIIIITVIVFVVIVIAIAIFIIGCQWSNMIIWLDKCSTFGIKKAIKISTIFAQTFYPS